MTKKTLAESSQEFHDAMMELLRVLVLEPFTQLYEWIVKLFRKL